MARENIMTGDNRLSRRRPGQVIAAVSLGMISQALILLSLPQSLPHSLQLWSAALPEASATHIWWLVIGLDVTMAAIYLFLLAMIFRGRNWARWWYITLVFIFVPLEIPSAFETAQSNYTAGLVSLLSTLADLAAAVLLMQKPAITWLKRTKPTTK